MVGQKLDPVQKNLSPEEDEEEQEVPMGKAAFAASSSSRPVFKTPQVAVPSNITSRNQRRTPKAAIPGPRVNWWPI